jgi:hypothetical protein
MTDTFYIAIGIAFLSCCGVWFLLSRALDALNEWLNRREMRQTEELRRLNAVVHADATVREFRRIF